MISGGNPAVKIDQGRGSVALYLHYKDREFPSYFDVVPVSHSSTFLLDLKKKILIHVSLHKTYDNMTKSCCFLFTNFLIHYQGQELFPFDVIYMGTTCTSSISLYIKQLDI